MTIMKPAQGALEITDELREYEAVIAHGLQTFYEVGDALLKIRDLRLYRQRGYKTFEDYCDKQWDLKERRAYQLIDAANVVGNLESCTNGTTLPDSERQVRPLVGLKSPMLQRAAWQEAQGRAATNGHKVTAAVVEEVAEEFKEQERANTESTGMEPDTDSAPEMELFTPPTVPARANLPMLPPVKDRGLFLPSPEEVDKIRAASNATFNRQDSDNIEWARWSWNPVTGCLHACPYCYARDIANRFYEQGFEPTFLPERLAAPRNTRPPILPPDAKDVDRMGWRNVFVCSMADLWGKWVPSEIIRHVLREAHEQAQWNYLYLTKFPARYEEFATEFPANTWVGTSVDAQHAVHRAEKAFAKLMDAGHEGVRWLSCEPLMEPLTFSSLSMFHWVIIGGASRSSQTPEFQPPLEWIWDLYQQARAAGCKVYFKTNLFGNVNRVREYPEA